MFIQDFIYYLQAPKYVGIIQGIEQSDNVTTIVVTGSVITEVVENTKVRIQGASSAFNGIYTVKAVTATDNTTRITLTTNTPSALIVTEDMNVTLYKEVNLTQTNVQVMFSTDNRTISLDNAEQPIKQSGNITNSFIKFKYDEDNNLFNLYTYGTLVNMYETQTQQEFKTIMDTISYNNLNDYFKGMYDLNTTLFSNLTNTEIDEKRTQFYNDMQDATIVDAGSFVIIPPDDNASVRVESIRYFISKYDRSEVLKLKYLTYGNSVPVKNPDGNTEIITCARACTFTFTK